MKSFYLGGVKSEHKSSHPDLALAFFLEPVSILHHAKWTKQQKRVC